MKAIGRVLVGAGVGLGVAVGILVVLIIISEWAIAHGWLDRYDDVLLAMICQGILVGAPIVGGWKAWVTR